MIMAQLPIWMDAVLCPRGLAVRTVVGVAVATVLGACAGGQSVLSAASPSPSALPASAYCLSTADAPQAVQFAGMNGQVLGSGHTGVVLTNGSADDPCVWMNLLPRLKQMTDLRILLYFYLYQGNVPANIASAARFLRSRGSTRVLLIGQSIGGAETLIAASQMTPPPDGAVSLSGESTPDQVRGLNVPTLILASEDDRYFPGSVARQVLAAIPAQDKHLKVFPGNLHGVELFDGPEASEALAALTGFLTAHVSSA